MIDYGRIRATTRPERKVIDEYSVWINTDIEEVSITEEDNTRIEFEFHQVRYIKDEYIGLIDEHNLELERQITDMQLALCDVYESITG